MHPQTQALTALCLMNSARAAREDIRGGRIVPARRHILMLYHISLYSGSAVASHHAMEEILRLESDINAFHRGEDDRFPRFNAEIIPFPRRPVPPELPPTKPGIAQLAGYAA